MSKRPSFQFYPPDWRTDAGLRLCSIAARGLWIEMMCLMHDASPYGHLTALGKPMTPPALARLVGEDVAQVKRWLTELKRNEVYSVDDEGRIYSRRMVRDEAVRDARAAGGPAGAEHGHKGGSHGVKGGRPRKEKTPLPDPERGVSEPSPSSSSPSPSPVSEANASGAAAPSAAEPLKPIDVKAALFSTGVALLTAAGKTDAVARSLIGKWKQGSTDAAVLDAMAAAQAASTPDPVSFITARLRNRNDDQPRRTFDRSSAWESRLPPEMAGFKATSLDH